MPFFPPPQENRKRVIAAMERTPRFLTPRVNCKSNSLHA